MEIIRGEARDRYTEILTPEALRFVCELDNIFSPRIETLLTAREKRQKRIDAGEKPDFLKETKEIRESEWKVAPIPADLVDRRVEITGPVERKMIINALNSGASVFMADFEDSLSPSWKNVMEGQINLLDAVRREIKYTNPEGREYELNEKTAVLMVRPRGLHLTEDHVLVGGKPVKASLFDFGLYMYHNVHELIQRETGPYFYLPKMQSHLEARLWNDVFKWTQDKMGIPQGTIRATVLVEHVLAAFEMDEILWELRDHSAGLNCGRWDYIFSVIKTFKENKEMLLPDRKDVTMKAPFMDAYARRLISVCHRRGIHAMGGMAAQIPIKNDSAANEVAIKKVVEDKEREVALGHDGTWVAHPGLVLLAKKVFEDGLAGRPNQLEKRRNEKITATDLLTIENGKITEEGLRKNINVGLLYLQSWLSGNGCVPLYNLMEDAATAEISRTQVWQWLKHDVINKDFFDTVFADELGKLIGKGKPSQELSEAALLFYGLSTAPQLEEFLTLPAYKLLCRKEKENE